MYARFRLTLHRVAPRRIPRPTVQDYLARFGLVLFIALIFTAADAFSHDGQINTGALQQLIVE